MKLSDSDVSVAVSEYTREIPAILVKGHLRKLNSARPNKLGGQRSNFYADARRSTHMFADSTEGIVAISKTGFAQRLYGGTITPVNRKYLTIPIDPEAYGMRVSDFPLAFVAHIKGKAYIAQKATDRSAPQLLFALVKSVTQQADPTVLPDPDAIRRRAASSVQSLIRQISSDPTTDPEFLPFVPD